jgi:hypothetical protein
MLDWLTPRSAAPRAADPLEHLPTAPSNKVRRIVNVFGKSGEGKTYYMSWLYRSALMRGASGTFVDTTGDNAYLARAGTDHVRAVVKSVDGWLAYVRSAVQQQCPFNLILQLDPARVDEFWPQLLRVGNQVCAIDEMDEYAPSNFDVKRTPLGRVISRGRHAEISLITTVRVPPELNKTLRGVADVTVSFRQESMAYAEVIARDSMHNAHPQLARMLVALPSGSRQFIRYRGGKLDRGQAPQL